MLFSFPHAKLILYPSYCIVHICTEYARRHLYSYSWESPTDLEVELETILLLTLLQHFYFINHRLSVHRTGGQAKVGGFPNNSFRYTLGYLYLPRCSAPHLSGYKHQTTMPPLLLQSSCPHPFQPRQHSPYLLAPNTFLISASNCPKKTR